MAGEYIKLEIRGIKQRVDAENQTALALLPENKYVGARGDQLALNKYEKIVVNGTIAAYAVGEALQKIREKKLYKNRFFARENRPFRTFEEYVKNIFTVSRMHAYRLIAYHYVSNLIGETANTQIPERLVRPLTSIKDEEAVKQLWKKAKAESSSKIPSSETLTAVVKEYKDAERIAKTEKKKAQCSEDDFFSELLQKKVTTEDPIAFIIAEAEKAKKRIERLQALYVDFQSHFAFSADDKKKLLEKVKEWQKADFFAFSRAIGK